MVRTAYHEAGHAVADVRFAFHCAHVTIVPRKKVGTLGLETSIDGDYYDYERESNREVATINPEQAKYQLIVLLAGYAAEIEKDPASKSQAKIGAESDIAKARDIHRRLGGKGTFAPWFRKARAFVRSNWRAINMVARDLIETKTLDGTEVETIVSIADGEPDAKEGLARYRDFIGRKGTRQFPFKIVQRARTGGEAKPS